MSHGGFSFGKNRPSGWLYLNTHQSDIATATWTIALLDAIGADFADGIEDTVNHKISPGVAGLYQIYGYGRFNQIVADKPYAIRLLLNGSTYLRERWLHGAVVNYLGLDAQIERWLSATDYVQLQVYHEAGVGTVDLYAGIHLTGLVVQRVR